MDCYRCLIQWGYQTVHGTNPVTYDLPIPFEEAPFTVAISTGNSGNHASCGGFTKTTIVLRAGTTAGVWDTVGFFIIGCQLQWGKILGDTVNLKIINFPVSFNECFGGLALFNGDPVAAAEYATITDITNTNFKIYMYANNAGTGYANANIFYLFLGAQPQWGENVGGGGQTVSLPISFEVAFTAVVSADSSWCNASCHITTTTITTMNYQSNRPDIAQAGPVQWLAIGIQPQWGFTVFDPAYYKNVNFTLPLSVNGTFCAFSTGYDAKGSTFLWHSMSHFNNVNVGVTGFVFDSRYTFTGLGYLAVCWQKQWGTAGGSATFAVPFTNVLNIVCASNNSENINCQVTSINNNGFSTNRSYQCKWLAIGI